MNERKEYDPTNKATVYVENGIFAKAGVENLMAQNKPILKVYANVEGKELEIALYFDMEYDTAIGGYTNKYKISKSGCKMLKCKKIVPKDAWKLNQAIASVTESSNERPQGDIGRDEFEVDIPF